MRIYSSPLTKYLSINISKLVIGTSLKKIITDINNNKTNMKLYVKTLIHRKLWILFSSIICLPFLKIFLNIQIYIIIDKILIHF